MKYDFCIVGGGIVGLSTAWQLQQRFTDKKVLLLEKQAQVGSGQTGHNSGVIHAGIYYAPNSLKADFCKRGLIATKQFCEQHKLPYETCGKLLVATDALELKRLADLETRAQANGIAITRLDEQALKATEPNIEGLGALLVHETGITNYRKITQKMADLFIQAGGTLLTEQTVCGIVEGTSAVEIQTTQHGQKHTFFADYFIACAGLMADRLVKMQGLALDFQIIPYRGEYYRLSSEKNQLIKHLIYPVPDPELPFLGVHLTKMIDGSITVGPNAVQGFKREGYGSINFDFKDVFDMLRFTGFWKVSQKHFKTGLAELKDSWCKTGYLKRVQKYCKTIELADLAPYPAGVRAQAVSATGELYHDFLFKETKRTLHVCNAPSPAATSAIPIGEYLLARIVEKIQ